MLAMAQIAVLSLYAPAADAFSEDCGRLIQMVAPHVAGAIAASVVTAVSDARPSLDRNAGGALRLVAAR